MTSGPLARYETALRRLAGRHRLRALAPRTGLDFSSNDYLGLASSTRLRDAVGAALARGVPPGAGGSRLLRGNHHEHEALEADAAAFFRSERALFLGGGYVANLALLGTLPQKGDLILLDALAHASMHEGARASRAETQVTPHNDIDALDRAILSWRQTAGRDARPWIIVESLYSMDGDRAPLADIMTLADRRDAFVLVDEAHATGVYGEDGRGLTAVFEGQGRENLIVLHTCGKALGSSGALVMAPRVLCEFLINRARPFIYATAPSPLIAATVREALAALRDEPDRRARLTRLIEHAGRELSTHVDARHAPRAVPTGSPIQPIIVGNNARAMALAAALQARGFDVRGVRPPTVPEGTARLRISLTLNVDDVTVSRLFVALGEELERLS